MAHAGSDFSLEVQPEGSSQWIEIGGYAQGLATIDVDEGVTTREIPGGTKQAARQSLGRKNNTATFTVDVNEITHPIFWRRKVTQMKFRYGVDGNATGNQRQSWVGFTHRNRNVPNDDAMTFDVTSDIIGEITRDVYP